MLDLSHGVLLLLLALARKPLDSHYQSDSALLQQLADTAGAPPLLFMRHY